MTPITENICKKLHDHFADKFSFPLAFHRELVIIVDTRLRVSKYRKLWKRGESKANYGEHLEKMEEHLTVQFSNGYLFNICVCLVVTINLN